MNELAVVTVILVTAFVLYFLPTIVASRRHKRNTPAIMVINLVFGWTLLGWMWAFVWALTTDAVDVM